jgi:hypothetical protein
MTGNNKKETSKANKNPSRAGKHSAGHHHVTWKDDAEDRRGSQEEADAAESVNGDDESDGEKMSIMEPNELWSARSGTLTISALQELFVEMCFFARLGFVQPPCCLRCTYRHAHDGAGSPPDGGGASDCRRYVVWRKNATSLLHPSNLGSNVVLVPCGSARLLMDGQVVSGYFWDAARKRLRSAPDAPSAGSADPKQQPKRAGAPAPPPSGTTSSSKKK